MQKSPLEIVNLMFNNDAFSKWLNIQILHVAAGEVSLQLTINKTMLNGFEIMHGGIAFALADSALAFAANSQGYQALSIDTSISYFKKVLANDVLIATSSEINKSKKFAWYQVQIKNQNQDLIALFKGTVSVSEKLW